MKDRFGDVARVHDHDDATRQPDDQRHAQKVACAADEGVDKPFLTQPSNDLHGDTGEQEQPTDFGHPPAAQRDSQITATAVSASWPAAIITGVRMT